MIRGAGLRLLVFTVVAVVLTVAIGAAIVGAERGDRYQLTATFVDAAGVRAGDAVRVAGVPVGSVTSVDVVAGRAEVGFTVERDVSLPRDSRVTVTWVDLIGNRQLDIEPGEDRNALEPGGRIERTGASMDIARLAAELGPLLGSLDPQSINQLLTSVDTILESSGDDIVAATGDVRTLVEMVGERSSAIETMLADYRSVAETMSSRERQLRQLIGDLTALAETFGGSEQLLVGAVDDATALVTDVESFLDANEADIRALVQDIAALVEVAQGRLDDLDRGLGVLPDALEGLFRVLRHGDHLRVDGVCLGFSEEPCIAVRDPGGDRATP